MSPQPFVLPPRQPDDRRAGEGFATENFAKQTPLNFMEFLDSMERRITALENRISRIFVDG
jgi:hypothetical protein